MREGNEYIRQKHAAYSAKHIDTNLYSLQMRTFLSFSGVKKDCDADFQPCLDHCGVDDCYLQCGNELGACKLSK